MASLQGILLNPLVTGPIWLILSRGPNEVREPIMQWLLKYVSATAINNSVTACKWLFALGAASYGNKFLSELAQNNWRWKSERHRYDWPKEIAVITGAAGGFGSLMSKSLAEKGVTVIAVDIAPQLPADMAKNPKIHYYRCDITNRQAVMDVASQVRSEHGDASILINNAGVGYNSNIVSASESHIRKTFEINIVSHYWTLAAWLPAMLSAKKGHVVTLASAASFVSPPGQVAYNSTKAGLLGLHEGLKAEARVVHQAPEVKFTIVHPSFAATPMTKAFEKEIEQASGKMLRPEVVSDAVVKQILSGRAAQIVLPENVSFISTLRAWPSWLSYVAYWALERGTPAGAYHNERVGGPKH